MTTIPPGTHLSRDDVVGHTIVSIVQSWATNDADGMDWAFTFFQLDSDAVFCLPIVDCGGFITEIPAKDVEPVEDPRLDTVLGHQIVQVLREGPESEIFHDSPYLILENGFIVTDVMGAPHGLGAPGLYVYSPDEIDRSRLTDFFD